MVVNLTIDYDVDGLLRIMQWLISCTRKIVNYQPIVPKSYLTPKLSVC